LKYGLIRVGLQLEQYASSNPKANAEVMDMQSTR
jgi:hypothetical protein